MDLPRGFFKQRSGAPCHLIPNCAIEHNLSGDPNAFNVAADQPAAHELSDANRLGA